jgi:hypothetical protein
MNISRMMRTSALALSIAAGSAMLSSCAVDGGYGYGPNVDVGVGFDYYDSPGYYGGWGRGYRVGPGRGGYHGDHHDNHDNHGHGSTHSYRAAPAGRSMPSIPSRGHSGGGGHGGTHH